MIFLSGVILDPPLDVNFAGFTVPLCHGDKWLVNKSPFIYGKHKIEYESRTYKKVQLILSLISQVPFYLQVVHLQYLTESTREILLYYIESQVPPGVAIEVRSYKLLEMPSKMKVSSSKISSRQVYFNWVGGPKLSLAMQNQT